MNAYEQVYAHLLAQYGPQHWWPADSPFEVMVGTILTQNTAWTNVERAIAALRQRQALSVAALRDMDESELAALIRPAGYFNQKTRRLKTLATFLHARGVADAPEQLRNQGTLAELRRDLLALNGIGPETADSMLLYALDLPIFVIDTYTLRLFYRLGLLQADAPKNTAYDAIRQQFEAALPQDAVLFNEYHALIVAHAKVRCKKQPGVPGCSGCPLDCPARLQCTPSF